MRNVPFIVLCVALMGAGCNDEEKPRPDGAGHHDAAPPEAAVSDTAGGADLTSLEASVGLEQGVKVDAIQGCYPKNYSLTLAAPSEVSLVLDRSGSMLEKGSTSTVTKWDELENAVDYVVWKFETTIRFGLLLFPADATCGSGGPQVPVGLGTRNTVQHFLSTAKPAGGTPTAAALNNAASSMLALGDKSAPKFIILATDGGPNCNYMLSASPKCSCTLAAADYCCTSYPSSCYSGETCLDEQHTLDTITGLRTKNNIVTYVIGLEGSAEYTQLLDAMAVAGGAPQTGGTTSYYKASNQTELQNALQKIATSVISCEIDLEVPPQYPDKVHVYVDGAEIKRDTAHQNGWDYADKKQTKIELYGKACTNLKDGVKHKVTATFACKIG